MEVWGFGPFDNDAAVEWCDRLAATPPDALEEFLASTCSVPAAVASFETACEVVAAAATILQLMTGRQESGSPYAPRFLLADGPRSVSAPTRRAASTALGGVLADGSTWHQEWADQPERDDAVDMARALQRELRRRL